MTEKRPRSNVQPWGAAVADVLADGEWHDGRRALLDAMALIPPGVAQRAAEKTRTSQQGAPTERVKPFPVEDQIRAGKRKLMSALVYGRVRAGVWETDPPYPFGSLWTGAPFRLRDTRSLLLSVPEIAERLDMPESSVYSVLELTSLNIVRRGRFKLLAKTDIPAFADEVKAWQETRSERRADATRRAMQTRAAAERNLFTPTANEAIDSILGPDPGTPARVRLERVAEQAAEGADLWVTLRLCRDELARLVVGQGDNADGNALRAVDKASQLLDLTAGLFPTKTAERRSKKKGGTE